MKYQAVTLKIGFWHPFGSHAGEDRCEILERKKGEIAKNGWTLWSFQHRTQETLGIWLDEVQRKKRAKKRVKIYVYCSAGKGSKDTKSRPKYCSYYIPINSLQEKKIPSKIKVPHPMKGKSKTGTAFMVKHIIYPDTKKRIAVEWYKDGKWEKRKLPTRPEYLIKRGKGALMPEYSVILELEYPYLAVVGRR